MKRIEEKFATLRTKNEKALIVYLTAGDPSLDMTKKLIFALEKAGVDILEIGVPFSDRSQSFGNPHCAFRLFQSHFCLWGEKVCQCRPPCGSGRRAGS